MTIPKSNKVQQVSNKNPLIFLGKYSLNKFKAIGIKRPKDPCDDEGPRQVYHARQCACQRVPES